MASYASSDDDVSRGSVSPARQQNLFSDSEDDDRGGGRISEAEEDNSLNRREGGASGQAAGGDKDSDDEAEEERKKAAQKKRDERKKPKGPVRRQMISEDLLTGKNGLTRLPDIFKDFKFGGKGRERQDLDSVLSKLEHWIHLLHPKQPFDQSLQRIEFLGGKRKVIKTHLKRIRMGMVNTYEENDVVLDDDEDDAMNNIDAEELAESASAFTKLANNLESQAPSTSSSIVPPPMATQTNNDNDFPDDDDDFFEAIDENTIVNAKAVVHDLEEMDMDDIPQDEDDDDIFMKQMEAQMKRAEMAETQKLEQEKQVDDDDVMEPEPSKDKHSEEQEQPASSIEEPVVIPEPEVVSPTPTNPCENDHAENADANTILVNDMTTIVVSGVSSDMEKTCAVDDDDDGIMLAELRDNDDN